MTDKDRQMIDRLSERVAALEAIQRKRAAFWETFWLFVLLATVLAPMVTGALILFGPWVVASIAVGVFVIWQIIARLIRRGGVWLGAASVAYQIVGTIAVVGVIAYVAWGYFN
jgi:hypothetical protein